MIGVDDRLVTPGTMKWVRMGLLSGLATIPTTIALYYLLGLSVDAAFEGSNLLRDWLAIFVGLVLLLAGVFGCPPKGDDIIPEPDFSGQLRMRLGVLINGWSLAVSYAMCKLVRQQVDGIALIVPGTVKLAIQPRSQG